MLRLGIPPDRVVPLTPGIDTDAFHPRFRDPDGTLRRILPVLRERSVKVLYVGRLSVEKNLPFLARVWPRIRCAADAQLLIVGDGPYRAAMQRDLARHDAHFLGFRHASELSALYASADLFLFPSATDTLGQAVLEAQSSGLPAIVSDRGGPCEFVVHETTGLVLPAPPAHDAEDRWIAGAQRLIADPVLRARMALAARAAIAPRTFARSFDRFWSVHRGASEHELT
jgi:glycosyltransferase involved in cell wall biosynthesis